MFRLSIPAHMLAMLFQSACSQCLSDAMSKHQSLMSLWFLFCNFPYKKNRYYHCLTSFRPCCRWIYLHCVENMMLLCMKAISAELQTRRGSSPSTPRNWASSSFSPFPLPSRMLVKELWFELLQARLEHNLQRIQDLQREAASLERRAALSPAETSTSAPTFRQADRQRDSSAPEAVPGQPLWYPVAFAARLGPENMIPFDLFNVPWLLFRDSDGQAACIKDECAHRACPLSLVSPCFVLNTRRKKAGRERGGKERESGSERES
jgi:hypothetical protein